MVALCLASRLHQPRLCLCCLMYMWADALEVPLFQTYMLQVLDGEAHQPPAGAGAALTAAVVSAHLPGGLGLLVRDGQQNPPRPPWQQPLPAVPAAAAVAGEAVTIRASVVVLVVLVVAAVQATEGEEVGGAPTSGCHMPALSFLAADPLKCSLRGIRSRASGR